MFDIIAFAKGILLWFAEIVGGLASILTGGDGMAKGLVSVALISWTMYLLRTTPRSIHRLFKRHFTTSVRYKFPTRPSTHIRETEAYTEFSEFLASAAKKNIFEFKRKFSKSGNGNSPPEERSYSLGNASGFFVSKGKLFHFSRSIKDGDKTTAAIDVINITVFFGSKEDIDGLIPATVGDTNRYVYKIEQYGGGRKKFIDERLLISEEMEVFLPSKLKTQIDNAIESFQKNRLKFLQRGIPYKLSFLFYGPPGTGKSTLIAYIAKKSKRSVVIPLESLSITSVLHGTLGFNGVICFEDIDAESFTKKRKLKKANYDEDQQRYDEDMATKGLGAFLNFLQGPSVLDDEIIVITTNHLEKLDPAIYRPGRVDELISVNYYQLEDMKEWVEFFYRELFIPEEFPEFPADSVFRPGDLAEFYKRHTGDIQSFYKDLRVRLEEIKHTNLMEIRKMEDQQVIEDAKLAKAKHELRVYAGD